MSFKDDFKVVELVGIHSCLACCRSNSLSDLSCTIEVVRKYLNCLDNVVFYLPISDHSFQVLMSMPSKFNL